MQLTAKLIQLLPIQTGSGKNGVWEKQDFIVETKETYPKKVVISNWNNKFDLSNMKVETYYTYEIYLESNLYNGNCFSSVILNREPKITPEEVLSLASGFRTFILSSLLIEFLPEVKGSNWTKREFIIEPIENGRKRYCVQVINEKVDLSAYSQGDKLNVEFFIESREFNNRWYTEFKVRKIDLLKKGDSLAKKYDVSDPNSWPF